MADNEVPERVWMHQERLLGHWFSVADECKEEGDIPYVPESELARVREALLNVAAYGTKHDPCWCLTRDNRDDDDHDEWCEAAGKVLQQARDESEGQDG